MTWGDRPVCKSGDKGVGNSYYEEVDEAVELDVRVEREKSRV